MGKKVYNVLVVLGKISTILFSIVLISLILMAVKLRNEEISIPCINDEKVYIIQKDEYLDLKVTSTCELQYIEIKVDNTYDKEKMKVVMLDISFELNNYKNVEILVYNDVTSLIGRIINKGEIIIN